MIAIKLERARLRIEGRRGRWPNNAPVGRVAPLALTLAAHWLAVLMILLLPWCAVLLLG